MKRFAVSSLSLALLGGSAAAQSPFLRPSGPVMPVSASAPALPNQQPGNVTPVRVHFGGALTKDGVVPVPIFLHSNARGTQPIQNPPPDVVPANQVWNAPAPSQRQLRQTSLQGGGGNGAPEQVAAPVVAADACADGSCYQPPHMEDYRRPHCEPRGHSCYAAGEFLYYWTKRQASPALLLVGDDVIGAEDFDGRSQHGGRFTLGYWIEAPIPIAIEGVFMFLGEESKGALFRSNGFPPISRPFTDVSTGGLGTVPVSAIGQPGFSNLETQSRIWGFEVNLRREIGRCCGGHFDMLIGYRQFQLDEGLSVTDNTRFGNGPFPLSGASVVTVDQFGVHNQIFGGQIGFEGEVNWRRFFLDVWGKFMLGSNSQTVNISGYTNIQAPPGPVGNQNLPGGVLAQTTNIGKYRDDSFTVMPEAGFNVGMNVTRNIRIAAGYSVFFLNNVIRPGDQIDTTVNSNLIPQLLALPVGAQRPGRPSFEESTYWAHGLNAQLEIRY